MPKTDTDFSELLDSARQIILLKIYRPDRLAHGLANFADLAFGSDLAVQSDYELQAIIASEIKPSHPIALASVPGYDASYKVDALCESTGSSCSSVAMGSPEGYGLADQAIAHAARNGTWVLLKNVHLAPAWLGQLEKRMHSLSPNPNFRLFLTMETNPVIPVNFLRQSRIVMNEPPPGVRANILDTLRGIPQARLATGPAEKSRLLFLLAWFHAVVQERLRYLPIGWSKGYEFNDSDFDTAVLTIDTWLGHMAKGKANVDPAQIPWAALKTLIKEAVYGGRVDSDYDQRVIDAFVDKTFSARAYDGDFALVDHPDSRLVVPEGTQMSHFLSWAQALPEREPPAWLGLPQTAETLVAAAEGMFDPSCLIKASLSNAGEAIVGKLRKMRTTDDEDDETVSTVPTSARPAWMTVLSANAQQWLSSLPTALGDMAHSTDPLERFFAREVSTGSTLLGRIRKDLAEMITTLEGKSKQTNELRALITDLNKGIFPSITKRRSLTVNRYNPCPLAQIQSTSKVFRNSIPE